MNSVKPQNLCISEKKNHDTREAASDKEISSSWKISLNAIRTALEKKDLN